MTGYHKTQAGMCCRHLQLSEGGRVAVQYGARWVQCGMQPVQAACQGRQRARLQVLRRLLQRVQRRVACNPKYRIPNKKPVYRRSKSEAVRPPTPAPRSSGHISPHHQALPPHQQDYSKPSRMSEPSPGDLLLMKVKLMTPIMARTIHHHICSSATNDLFFMMLLNIFLMWTIRAYQKYTGMPRKLQFLLKNYS